jgi:hypothetical protein
MRFANAWLCQNVDGAKIVVTINGFTDSSNSAGAFAAFALSNHLPVAVWELCNEPYTLAGTGAGTFFLNATDYVARMKPFRDAIKAADSNAVVAIYFNDAGYAEPNTWDNDLKKYTDKWWDAVVYHHYPSLPTSGVTFADLMALDNWQLASNTTARVTNYLIPDNNSNMTFLISEFNPARGDGAGGNYPPTTTLYGAIYTAEYLLDAPLVIIVQVFLLQIRSGRFAEELPQERDREFRLGQVLPRVATPVWTTVLLEAVENGVHPNHLLIGVVQLEA